MGQLQLLTVALFWLLGSVHALPSDIAVLGEKGAPAALYFSSGDPRVTEASVVAGEALEVRSLRGAVASFSEKVAQLPVLDVSDLAVDELSVSGVKQWALWHLDSFDSGEDGNWSSNERSSCTVAGDSFLGGHCHFASTNASKRFSGLPQHEKVKVRARLHFIDEWEGESLFLEVDGRTVWSQSHSWCPGLFKWKCTKFGIDSCGRETPDRLSVKAEAILEHSAENLEVGFASSFLPGSDACHA
eukprot:CAMPEP_0197625764 /NCGR_PEP_ID=MMETSP1338-20131121/5035_1 /TAXON_ID=43686 ORGANISM="Pelagodinium beii, Strain RCC1491" /NCGR_SAMPLE_ID=MMETSP1338 /ASSEMBLY_ACC=CAM_ASM_000754 /LENGTH=243 /DNA_ID=CAMNT_0043196247 /DNA_START=102 /DNA_END=829 /DNA_ORIENTATION=+